AGAPPAGYRNAVGLTEFWSTVTRDGVKGDPTKATAEKGRALLDAAVDELVAIVREFKARPIVPRTAHQSITAPTGGYFRDTQLGGGHHSDSIARREPTVDENRNQGDR